MKRTQWYYTALMWVIVLACILGLHFLANAQDLNVLPTAGKSLGYASSPEPGGWLVLGEGFKVVAPIVAEDNKSIVFEAEAGEYAILFFPANAPIPQPRVAKVVLGAGADDGGNDPNPPDPVEKKWQIMFFYDGNALDNLPSRQREILISLALRKRLVAAGHTVLEVLESSAVNAGGAPAKYDAFINAVVGDPLPRIALAPKDGGKVIDFPLPPDESALMLLLKEAK